MKIMVLGHNGLLGHTVIDYFKKQNIEIITSNNRWPNENFKNDILTCKCDYLINCIGSIPQTCKNDIDFYQNNLMLPVWIASTKIKMIYPTTDCEFDGILDFNLEYKKTDIPNSTTSYGISKYITTYILNKLSKNTKVIRTSIIGLENQKTSSLLSWFLNQKVIVTGYNSHLWNGITTLEWSKQCYNIINNWKKFPSLIQIGTEKISKYDLLNLFSKVFDHKIIILREDENKIIINKCLVSDFTVDSLENQLIELKNFYNL